MIVVTIAIVVGMTVCAIQAIRAVRVLNGVMWLAGCSALLSVLLYQFGAPLIAVMELSVGAGLITVLMVFSIGVAGEDSEEDVQPVVPVSVALISVVVAVAILAWLLLPLSAATMPMPSDAADFQTVFW
ncbi:MAG: hypothetical protein GYB68_14360, partial [Chloroflexi bacterium]|nr:hypothetical protein [Chloroflexota bacterium]